MRSLGIDTSNYTTSVALFDGEHILQKKKLLPVKQGERGLRQSDALFHHTVQLPTLLEELEMGKIDIIGVSDRPRAAEGSYMPCFLAGIAAARMLSTALNIPLKKYSHQQGHLAAALFSAQRLALVAEEFLAFHISGGTTEGLLVGPNLQSTCVCATGDLNAGQLLDRVGVLLGYPFPAGAAVDELSQTGVAVRKIRTSKNGELWNFSGVENQCIQMKRNGVLKENIARYCVEMVAATLLEMISFSRAQYGNLPLLCAGGVCCSKGIRQRICEKYPEILFARTEYSADNAAGIAILAGLTESEGACA
jgi:N6-L-threonylcarbamoyladenine synthase